MRELGYSTKIADMYTFITGGGLPYVYHRNYLYIFDMSAYSRGMLWYTKFTKDGTEAIHSVEVPITNGLMLGETLDHAEGLREKLPPKADSLPPLLYAIIF